MILFYTDNIDGKIAHLDTEQARHCVQVLRKQEGDAISFVDGTGGFYEGIIQETGKKKCAIQIIKTQQAFNKRPFNLHIAIAPTKNTNRLEWFLEKSLKAYLPKLNEPISFKQFIQLPRTNLVKYIAQGAENTALKDNYTAKKDVLLLIGPEGDFSKAELSMAFDNGFLGIHLGKSRLRTETAGIVACHTLNLLNE